MEGLSHERIVAKAIELLDEHGARWLTMRHLGAALGVKAPALYPYVQSKTRLALDIFETVIGRSDYRPDLSLPWLTELGRLMHQIREEILRHPWVTHLIPGSSPRRLFYHGETVQEILQRAGLTESEALRYRRLLSWTVWGFVSIEVDLLESSRHMPVDPGAAFPRRYLVATYPKPDQPPGEPRHALDVDDLFAACVSTYL